MSYPQYEEWRRARLRNAVDQGWQPERIPTFMTLKRYLGGSWFTVKVRAGVTGAEEYALTRSHRLTYTREQVEDAVRDAASYQLGPDPDLGLLQPGQYKLWRDNKLARLTRRSVSEGSQVRATRRRTFRDCATAQRQRRTREQRRPRRRHFHSLASTRTRHGARAGLSCELRQVSLLGRDLKDYCLVSLSLGNEVELDA